VASQLAFSVFSVYNRAIISQGMIIMKKHMDSVTWRFRSWALIPTADHWSNWMHCTRQTMLDTIAVLKRTNEHSSVLLSPHEKYRRVIDEVEVIDYKQYGSWRWLPHVGWKFISGEDGTPHGKGKRPTHRKTAAEQAADDKEIFG